MGMTKEAKKAARAQERAERKAANAAISAEAKTEREKIREARRLARGEGLYAKKLKKAIEEHEGDPLKQLECLFEFRDAPAAKGRERIMGQKRHDDIKQSMRSFIQMLPNLRHGIQNLDGFNMKHVVALLRAWQETGLSPGAILGYLSILRRFFCFIGKPKELPQGKALDEMLAKRGLQLEGRCYIPDFQKGWRDLGHDPIAIIEQIRLAGYVVEACNLEMMYAWGLRFAEAIGIQPHESERETHGAGLAITRNTKGGKHRVVYYLKNDTDFATYQREVLERAKALAKKHPKKILALPGLKLSQMKSRLNWVMRKFGLTKKALGITAHGLRHQFACDLFRDVCGMPAPVLGLLPASEYRRKAALVDEAMLEVSKQLGHERKDIANRYTGSPEKLDKAQRTRINGWLDRLILAADAFRNAGVYEAWMVDTCGRGGVLRTGESMRLAVRLGNTEGMAVTTAMQLLETLRGELERATSFKIAVDLWVHAGMPDEAIEVVFDPNQGRPRLA
jgi:site-specific recombinase XerD